MFGFAQNHHIDGQNGPRPLAAQASDSIVPLSGPDSAANLRQARNARRGRVASSDSIVGNSDTIHSRAMNTSITPMSIRKPDTLARRKSRSGLDQIVEGKNTDSLYYDIVNRKVYIYNQGDIKYADKGLQADFMRIDMNTKEIYAYGKPDTVNGEAKKTQPVFTDGGGSYTMDTITYNFDSEKALIRGVATQQGDGWLVGGKIKKQPDNTINIQQGKYTTCDHTDHPHFYLAMTKAKVIPGKKIITGPAYLVMEDVPIYPLCIPEGFFPISSGAKSGLLMPNYGEDASRGFFLRGLGYYFILNKHMDLALTGGFYTLGSWEVNASSRYVKRYKYSGNLSFDFSCVKTGDKG